MARRPFFHETIILSKGFLILCQSSILQSWQNRWIDSCLVDAPKEDRQLQKSRSCESKHHGIKIYSHRIAFYKDTAHLNPKTWHSFFWTNCKVKVTTFFHSLLCIQRCYLSVIFGIKSGIFKKGCQKWNPEVTSSFLCDQVFASEAHSPGEE